jgi:hypothetical protein
VIVSTVGSAVDAGAAPGQRPTIILLRTRAVLYMIE